MGIDNSITNAISRAVQNGAGSPPAILGDELVLTNTFDADTNWNKGVGVTITGGQLVYTTTSGIVDTSQVKLLEVGKRYRTTITVDEVTSGSVRTWFFDGSGTASTNYTQAGVYSSDHTCPREASSVLIRGTNFDGKIGSTSVKEITGY